MKKIFLFLLLFFFSFSGVYATQVLVENVFSDISADYEYRDELQLLFDRGMVYPDEQGRFNPYQLLDRDEFVGISMEVICIRCIQPHTEFQYIQKYTNTQPYYDIDGTNKYFYCVAEADANNYVKGYDASYQCEDGTQRDSERPFCSNNQITLEEAVAVLLRNSGIFTIEDNQFILNQVNAGTEYPILSDDVSPTNSDGTPYTFYGYFQKALDFKLVEYDELGNEKIYTMIDKIDNKLRPKKSITKEEFLRMAYIALKSNSCTDVVDNEIALAIDIWEKTCKPGDTDCTLSKLDDPKDTYDFTPDAKGFCEEGIEDPTGYIWRFYNLTNGDEFFEYGSFLDNIVLQRAGERRVYLTVIDKCGNTAQVYSTIIVEDTIDVELEVLDPGCSVGGNCQPISEKICEDTEVCDFQPKVVTSCNAGIKNPDGYYWTFFNEDTGENIVRDGVYIDNFEFLTDGTWKVSVTVTDNCGNSGTDFVFIDITDIDIDIIIHDPDCTADGTCPSITEEACGEEEVCDFEPKVTTTCPAGIKDPDGYTWIFTHLLTGTKVEKKGRYIENFVFSLEGKRRVTLTIDDNCGNTGNETNIIIIGEPPSEIALNVDIIANPIIGYKNLLVDYDSIVYGGTPPFRYYWTFGDGGTGVGKVTSHIFTRVDVFETKLTVFDRNNLTGSATVLIKVLEGSCEVDSDGDGIIDCDDICPDIPGPIDNNGCPVVEISCDDDQICPSGYSCNTDIVTENINGICLPDTPRDPNCLYNPTKSNIFGNASCNSCPCSNYADFLADIRNCDIVFPAITSPDAREIYSRGGVYQIRY